MINDWSLKINGSVLEADRPIDIGCALPDNQVLYWFDRSFESRSEGLSDRHEWLEPVQGRNPQAR